MNFLFFFVAMLFTFFVLSIIQYALLYSLHVNERNDGDVGGGDDVWITGKQTDTTFNTRFIPYK